MRRRRLQGACGEIENGTETDGNDGAHETDDVVGHTEIRGREGDEEWFGIEEEESVAGGGSEGGGERERGERVREGGREGRNE